MKVSIDHNSCAPPIVTDDQASTTGTSIPARNSDTVVQLRVYTNVMQSAGIMKGDTIVVDRALQATNGRVVVAALGNELLLRQIEMCDGRLALIPGHAALSPIDGSQGRFSIWGVVTHVVRAV